MTNLAVSGDAATWSGTIVAGLAFLAAVYGMWRGHRQEARQREDSDLAHRQTEAAERRAHAVERMVERWMAEQSGRANDEISEDIAVGHEAHWTLVRQGKSRFALRNDSTLTVTGVHVVPDNIPLSRHLPEDAVLSPGQAAEFLVFSTLQRRAPNEIWVRWDGVDEPVAVRLCEE